MTDAIPTPPTAGKPADPTAPAAPEEWKPEPRQWTWKDLFTAPMLAFKPKCMLASAVTVIAISLWMQLLAGFGVENDMLESALSWVWAAVGLVIFSLGATLVSVFMKADLLDDEFLSFREALSQYKSRVVPAVLVPLFLVGLLAAFNLLIALTHLIAGIPIVGATGYAVLYPLVYVLGLFVFLLTIAVFLSVFVFPSIVAIRKHGWFDNVVDTFEAVGTKPHILVASLLLIGIMIAVCFSIGNGGMVKLKTSAETMGWDGLNKTEQTASKWNESFFSKVLPFTTIVPFANTLNWDAPGQSGANPFAATATPAETEGGYYRLFTGPIAGLWQILISSFILGYCMNLFVGGGMLTYLVVREDDYWDDEDLEDLDQLAKELEEEAKQEQAKAPVTSSSASSDAAAPVPPAPAS
jgi:hypothetical protein